MPKISILTPVYIDVPEKVDWLEECIQSVINQTETDWEMILIDDKSLVSFDYVKAKYTDPRLRWLENAENFGPAMTRNNAANLAESDCLLPLDSDDALAAIETLAELYAVWEQDKTKTVYGNVQLYRLNQGQFERSKIYSLAEYTFEVAMNLEFGIMPVTAMHSKDAHIAAGGWKAALKNGREDMEYWIACGKAGYCGQKINKATLLYRKHEQSRDYKLKFHLKDLKNVQRQIMEMHSDIYNGRFPVACCGGKGNSGSKAAPSSDPTIISQQNQGAKKVSELEGYDQKDLEWVAYQGGKGGSFDVLVRGPANLPPRYHILGTGHFFQIHRQQKKFFEDRQHLGFRVNQPDPRQAPSPPPPPNPEPQVVPVPRPELGTLVRLDRIASETRDAEIKQVEPRSEMAPQTPIAGLGLSERITKLLQDDLWTVEKLAAAEAGQLTAYSGIGRVTARNITDKAKKLIASQ